jgi:hypothetical protein
VGTMKRKLMFKDIIYAIILIVVFVLMLTACGYVLIDSIKNSDGFLCGAMVLTIIMLWDIIGEIYGKHI